MTDTSQFAGILLLTTARRATSNGWGSSIRKAAGLSQQEVADAVGVTQATLSRWERGERKPQGEPAMSYGLLLCQLAEQIEAEAA